MNQCANVNHKRNGMKETEGAEGLNFDLRTLHMYKFIIIMDGFW